MPGPRRRRPRRDSPPREGPLYLHLVRTLSSEISAGRFSVGTRLPTESALAGRFGVSRHTVRDALRHLREAGLITSRQGSGSTVIAAQRPPGHLYAVSSLSELLQYAHETTWDVDRCVFVVADRRLAARLGCSPGRRWLRVQGLRYARRDAPPICWVDLFVHADYGRIRTLVGKREGPVLGLVEDMFGERIGEVMQTLRAATVPDSVAAGLRVRPDTAALEIERIIRSTRHKVIAISFSLHPIDRFSYAILLRREEHAGATGDSGNRRERASVNPARRRRP